MHTRVYTGAAVESFERTGRERPPFSIDSRRVFQYIPGFPPWQINVECWNCWNCQFGIWAGMVWKRSKSLGHLQMLVVLFVFCSEKAPNSIWVWLDSTNSKLVVCCCHSSGPFGTLTPGLNWSFNGWHVEWIENVFRTNTSIYKTLDWSVIDQYWSESYTWSIHR